MRARVDIPRHLRSRRLTWGKVVRWVLILALVGIWVTAITMLIA